MKLVGTKSSTTSQSPRSILAESEGKPRRAASAIAFGLVVKRCDSEYQLEGRLISARSRDPTAWVLYDFVRKPDTEDLECVRRGDSNG